MPTKTRPLKIVNIIEKIDIMLKGLEMQEEHNRETVILREIDYAKTILTELKDWIYKYSKEGITVRV